MASSHEWEGGLTADSARTPRRTSKIWMVLDVVTIVGAAVVATMYEMHTGPLDGARGLWRGTLFQNRPMWILLALLCGFTIALIVTSRRLHLYTPTRLTSVLGEQRLSVQACFTSGLLLTGTLYVVHADDIPRSIVLITLGLVTVSLSLRRFAYRFLLYNRYDRGVGTRNVLIVGTGPEAHALRHHLESIRHLGYTFKGFIDSPAAGQRSSAGPGEVVGTLDTLFQRARPGQPPLTRPAQARATISPESIGAAVRQVFGDLKPAARSIAHSVSGVRARPVPIANR